MKLRTSMARGGRWAARLLPLAGLAASGAALGAVVLQEQPASEPTLAAGPGRELVQHACTQCHGLSVVLSVGRTADGWNEIVQQMVANGAPLEEAQARTVTDYLARYYPAPVAGPPAVANAPAAAPRR